MKLLNVLAVFAFIAMAKGAVTQCRSCVEENIANCTTNEEMFNCSNAGTFPNLGTTDCYTASAYYMEGNQMKSGVARGCGNCSVTNDALPVGAKEQFRDKFNEYLNATLDLPSFNIKCCDNANNCNNQIVSPSSPATTTTTTGASVAPSGGTDDTKTPTSHATRLFPISGIVAFVAIFLAVTL